jgi:hypothetical protein
MIDLGQITTMLSQLVPVIVQVAMIAAVLSVVFGFLMPMLTGLFKA